MCSVTKRLTGLYTARIPLLPARSKLHNEAIQVYRSHVNIVAYYLPSINSIDIIMQLSYDALTRLSNYGFVLPRERLINISELKHFSQGQPVQKFNF